MRPRLPLLALLLAASGCATATVESRSVALLPLEVKLDLIEAENEMFVAVDAVDEQGARALDAREQYRRSADRIQEAKDVLDQVSQGKDKKQLEVAQLSLKESRERREFLDLWTDVQFELLSLEKAKLEAARARLERVKAKAVKKANVLGAEKIELAAFDKAVLQAEERVKQAGADADKAKAEAEKLRGGWMTTRRDLAQRTGGGQGSPWVQ